MTDPNVPRPRLVLFQRALPVLAGVLLVAAVSGCGMVEKMDVMIGQMNYTNQQIAETNARLAKLQEAAEVTRKQLAPLEKLGKRLQGLSGDGRDEDQAPPPLKRP